MKKFLPVVTGFALLTVYAVADFETSMFINQRDMPLLCSVAEAGGGPTQFRSEDALVKVFGKDKTKAEIDRLNAQFGEGKVYRFFAVYDFIVPEALRAGAVGYATPYEPTIYGRSVYGDWIRAGVSGSSNFSSQQLMDRALGRDIHAEVMKSADARFGEGASTNFHQILDQLCRDLAADVGVANIGGGTSPSP